MVIHVMGTVMETSEELLGNSSEKTLENGLLVGFILLLLYTLAASVIEAKRVGIGVIAGEGHP